MIRFSYIERERHLPKFHKGVVCSLCVLITVFHGHINFSYSFHCVLNGFRLLFLAQTTLVIVNIRAARG